MAGGGGTRLWPLSDDKHPKPLLEVFSKQTMLEQTIFRARLFADDFFILTSKEISEHAKESFENFGVAPEQIIVEPDGADTAAAIAFAIAHIKTIYERATYEESVIVTLLPVDHRIKNHGAFYRDIRYATKAAQARKSLVLFGITPFFASAGYGYIQLGSAVDHQDRDTLFKVNGFLEKPTQATANKLLRSADYVWNSGIFIGTVSAYEARFKQDTLLYEWYVALCQGKTQTPMPEMFRNFQFEHGIIEHAKQLLAVIATFDWVDIGTYNGLYSSLPQTDENGNSARGDTVIRDCQDCLIIGNHKKIVALGLSDIAVIDGPDGILVCKKSTHSQIVGKAATDKEQPNAQH
jgi:mannose-1-phosphate guanylyltransferase/mannose-6-phosphate isomerase